MSALTRRSFVKQTLATAAAVTGLAGRSARAANKRLIVGVMGLGGRGTALAEMFASRPDAEIAWLCDPESERCRRAAQRVEKAQNRPPKVAADFRRILEDKHVDVFVNATPDHWHALAGILACQAGKDVYVEKPMAHSIWEGRKLIEAVRKYRRVLQVGMQSRSAPYARRAVDYLRGGQLGDVHLVRVYNMMQHPLRKPAPSPEPPPGFDYDLWCGPAPRLPYGASRAWLNYSEFSCGPIPGDAVHQLDLARLLLGDPSAPKSVLATGGIYALRDGRDTPDTQLATFDYENCTLLFQASLWTPYMKKIPVAIRDSDDFPDWEFCATKIEVLGTKGLMYLGRHGGGWHVHNADGERIASTPGRQADREHLDDFFACVRDRRQPNANVEQGHATALLCHLANIACRVGNQKLVFDAATETFPDTPAANAHLKRAAYRAPWVVPEVV